MSKLKPRSRTAVIAGGGIFPSLIVDKLRDESQEFIVLAIKGSADESLLEGTPCQWINLGDIGKILKILKNHEISQITFAGNIVRPSLLSMKMDTAALLLLAKFGIKKLSGGSDNLHSVVVKIAEENGLKIISPEKIAPDLRAPRGVIGRISPSASDEQDINLGQKILAALGTMDVGQSIIVENEHVLGIEAAEGTDQLISRCGVLKKEESSLGVLVKMKKTNQEERIDLPVIGVDTIKNVYKAGFKGIAIEANYGLILNLKEVINIADELGIFIIGILEQNKL